MKASVPHKWNEGKENCLWIFVMSQSNLHSWGRDTFQIQCEIKNKYMSTALVRDYQRSKREWADGPRKGQDKIDRLACWLLWPHSSIFKTSFPKRPNTIRPNCRSGRKHQFHIITNIGKLPPEIPCLTCDSKVKLDLFLQIRHGSCLT